MAEIILIVVGIALFFLAIIVVTGAATIASLDNARLEPLSDDEARRCIEKAFANGIVDPAWESQNGFEPAGAFKVTGVLGSPNVVAWSKNEEATYLCIYLINANPTTFDIVTIWENGALTTGSTRDGQMIPTTGQHWGQTFSNLDAASNWQRHIEATEYLKLGHSLRGKAPDLENDFVTYMRMQAKYVRSLPAWPLRIPYWYFVRRYVRHGKTVQELEGS